MYEENLQRVIEAIEPIDETFMRKAEQRVNSLTKPVGSLGKLEKVAVKLAGITKDVHPIVRRPGILVFAADHGISDMGVSAYPKEVTAQMIANFLSGGAAINAFARQIDADLKVIDIGVAQDLEHDGLIDKKVKPGTNNFAYENAMSVEEAQTAIQHGMDVASETITDGAKSLIVGEMGIGNTTTASAVVAVITGRPIDEVVGIGTGITEEIQQMKREILEQALADRQPRSDDAIDILTKVGGCEIAGMMGAILKAAEQRIPIILDGFISTAAALLAVLLNDRVREYLIAGHLSQEPGHQHALVHLDKTPLLKLDLRLGEGTGAALAFPLVESATLMMKEMATFESAGVSSSSEKV